MLTIRSTPSYSFFFFNDTATTEIYTLSLHDALPISALFRRLRVRWVRICSGVFRGGSRDFSGMRIARCQDRLEEHTSELQSHLKILCRLFLVKKKKQTCMLKMRINTFVLHKPYRSLC